MVSCSVSSSGEHPPGREYPQRTSAFRGSRKSGRRSRTALRARPRLPGPSTGRWYGPKRLSSTAPPPLKEVTFDMPGTLVIVESPAKAKTIEKYLGGDYAVRASFGHVRDLPKSQLGVDVDDGFEPVYEVPEDSKRHVAELKRALKGADELVLATDYDREGEAIAYPRGHPARRLAGRCQAHHVHRDHAGRDPRVGAAPTRDRPEARRRAGGPTGPRPPRRVPDQPDPVEEGAAGPVGGPGAIGRGPSDRRAGARDPGVRPGRVLERRRPIDARGGRAAVRRAAHGDPRRASSPPRPRRRGSCSAPRPTRCRTWIGSAKPRIGSSTSSGRSGSGRPAPPFTTSTLQQEAARKLGFSARKTMTLAQRLYEGISLPGEGSVGLITYMRTDSVTIADSALREIAELVKQEYGPSYALAEHRRYKTRSRNAQEAHEAVRPTSVFRTPERVAASLDRDQLRLYDLIWKRTVATQMAEARFDQVGVDIQAVDGRRALRPARDRPDARVRRVHPRLHGGSRRGTRRGRGVAAARAVGRAAPADARAPARAALHAATAALLGGLAREDPRGARASAGPRPTPRSSRRSRRAATCGSTRSGSCPRTSPRW